MVEQVRERQERQRGLWLVLLQGRYHLRPLTAHRLEGYQPQQLPDARVCPVYVVISMARKSAGTESYVEQVLHSAVGVVEAGPQRTHYLFPLKAHLHHVVDGGLESIASQERVGVSKRPVLSGRSLNRCKKRCIRRLRCSGGRG